MVKIVAAACAVTLLLVACQAPAGGETEPAIVTTAATATATTTATAVEQRGSTQAQPPAVISCTFPDVPAARQLAERMVADRSLIASTAPSTVAFAVYDYATGVTTVCPALLPP